MRILNISAQKPDSTGSGVFLAEMVRCMRRAGHDVAVVCGAAPEDDPAASLAEGVLVRPVRFETDALPFPVCGMSDVMPYRSTRYRDMTPRMVDQFALAFGRTIAEVDAEFDPDLVICHHLYLLTAIVRRMLAHRAVCGISHSTDLRQMVQHDLEHDSIVGLVRQLDRIFALHEDQACEIERIFGVPRDLVMVIGTGFDAQLFSPGDRWSAGAAGANAGAAPAASGAPAVRPAEPHVLYVGKIGFAKGVESLLEAYDLLAQRGVRCALDLVGGHSDEIEYDRIVARAQACAREPHFLGKVPTGELVERYRASDVFVLPSFFEGLPLVIAEALACGCKVVTTDLPGIRSFYGRFLPDAPIVYVEPPHMHDVDKPDLADLPAFEARLADAIERALALPAHQCDVSGLSWERLTERVLAAAPTRE